MPTSKDNDLEDIDIALEELEEMHACGGGMSEEEEDEEETAGYSETDDEDEDEDGELPAVTSAPAEAAAPPTGGVGVEAAPLSRQERLELKISKLRARRRALLVQGAGIPCTETFLGVVTEPFRALCW